MTAKIVIFGGGGVAREVAWILFDEYPGETPCAFVVADRDWVEGKTIDGICSVPDREFDPAVHASLTAFIGIGAPESRKLVHERIRGFSNIRFPALVHKSSTLDRRLNGTLLGQGTIVYPLASITTGVSLGDFVQINPCATIGHGARIGDYTTVCPGAHISGEVRVGARCFIGAGAVVKEGVSIADDCLIGAGAVVVDDILEPGRWKGVPARKIDR